MNKCGRLFSSCTVSKLTAVSIDIIMHLEQAVIFDISTACRLLLLSPRNEAGTACQTFCEVCESSAAFGRRSVGVVEQMAAINFLICSPSDSEYLVLTPGIRRWSSYFPPMTLGFGEVLWEWWCLVSCGGQNSGPAGARAPSWKNNSPVCHPYVQSQNHLQAVWELDSSRDALLLNNRLRGRGIWCLWTVELQFQFLFTSQSPAVSLQRWKSERGPLGGGEKVLFLGWISVA